MRLKTLAFIALLGVLAACANSGRSLEPLRQSATQGYSLGSGDRVRITTFGQQNLSGEFAVNEGGAIALPLVGSVPAAGKTTAQLEQEIEKRLSNGLVRNPSVTAEVITFRPFFILGEVEKPGQYQYVDGMTVLTAVAIGGGFTPRAQTGYVSITRSAGGKPVEGRAERNTVVMPGDVINVYERYF